MIRLPQGLLCCPGCRTVLDLGSGDGNQHCPSCNREFRVRDGIIDFIPDEKFYWGEIDEQSMRAVNENAERQGWLDAITAEFSERPNLMGYILDPARVAWIFDAYDPGRTDACLDLGSGWGAISFGLGKLYKQVYSLDGVYQRLHFQSLRAGQEGVSNLTFLRGSMSALPFPDGSIDLAVINGLLEWIGLSGEKADPQQEQLAFLREVRRVLRKGGKAVIGIENRYGVQYFLGGKDHSGLRFTSLVPRRAADWMVRTIPRSPDALVFSGAEHSYRTLTYSYWGYRSLLSKAGFEKTTIQWVWPGYNYARVSGSMDGRSVRQYLRMVTDLMDAPGKRLPLQVLFRLPEAVLTILIRAFAPSFMIVADNLERRESIRDSLIRQASPGTSLLRLNQGPRADLRTTYLQCGPKGLRKISRVLRLGLDRPAKFQVNDEAAIQGNPLRTRDRSHIELAAKWLVDYQAGASSGSWDSPDLVKEIHDLRTSFLKVNNDRGLLASLDGYTEAYLSWIGGMQVPIVKEHGDFTPSNILVRRGEIVPVDWEHARKAGHPFMDAGAFSLALLRRSRATGSSGRLEQFGALYLAGMGLPIRSGPAYYLLRIVNRCIAINGLGPFTHFYVGRLCESLRLALEWAAVRFGSP